MSRTSYYTDDELMRLGFIEEDTAVDVISFHPKGPDDIFRRRTFPWVNRKLELVADNRWIYDFVEHRFIHSDQSREYIKKLIEE